MALLWLEGFESSGTDAAAMQAYLPRKYNSNVANASSSAGRFGDYCCRLKADSYFEQSFSNKQTWVIGFAFKPGKWRTISNEAILQILDNNNIQIELTTRDYGNLRLRRGGATLITTTNLGLKEDTWYYIELKVKIDNAGEYELRVNGKVTLSGNGDTQDTANAYANQIRFIGDDSLVYFYFDDIYILDTTGARNNDFLGNVRIEMIKPDGDTADADFTPLNAGNNYVEVDDGVTVDDDTTYVETAIPTDKDLYNYSAATLTIINSIMIDTESRETDAENFNIKTIVKSGVTESADAGQILSSNYTIVSRVIENDPNTAIQWLLANLNNATFGFEAV